MPQIIFLPSQNSVEVEKQTKILVAARKASVAIRFGCAACRCGMCGILVTSGQDHLSPMKKEEENLIKRLKLSCDGSVRLACQARIEGDCIIDLDFQENYNPDIGIENN